MARSELALQQGWFQKVGDLTPTAAFDEVLSSTGDEELARSCRFLAILHRDYGKEVAWLVNELFKLRQQNVSQEGDGTMNVMILLHLYDGNDFLSQMLMPVTGFKNLGDLSWAVQNVSAGSKILLEAPTPEEGPPVEIPLPALEGGYSSTTQVRVMQIITT